MAHGTSHCQGFNNQDCNNQDFNKLGFQQTRIPIGQDFHSTGLGQVYTRAAPNSTPFSAGNVA
jgi:hypothetical protein